jgi:hypothetical protein
LKAYYAKDVCFQVGVLTEIHIGLLKTFPESFLGNSTNAFRTSPYLMNETHLDLISSFVE